MEMILLAFVEQLTVAVPLDEHHIMLWNRMFSAFHTQSILKW